MQCSQELHCELNPLSDHYVLWKVTCPQNYVNLSLFLSLSFSTTTCPNQASNFIFRFSPSLLQALSYTCLSVPHLPKTTSVTYSGETNTADFICFQTFPKENSQGSGEEQQPIAPAEKSNEQDCKNRRFTAPMDGGKEMLFHTCVPPTHSEYSMKNSRAKRKD